MNVPAGKGTIHRPTDFEEYDKRYEMVFGKSKLQLLKERQESELFCNNLQETDMVFVK
jgi:hypothetical protein